MGRSTATSACGRRSPSTKSSASSTCRSRRRRRTSTAAIGPGNNLFAESLVCVDLKTGQRKWHFQFVHHPLWNYDMSSAPILADITVNGKRDQGRRGAEQAGVALRLRSRHRPAGVADRRAAGAAVRRAGREDVADAAVPDQAAGVRAQRAQGARRSDRLHAGAARAGARSSSKRYKARPSMFNAADPRQRQRPARRDQHGQRGRRHELAGRRLRSRDAHRLSRTASNAGITSTRSSRRRRVLGHPLRLGRRRAGRSAK